MQFRLLEKIEKYFVISIYSLTAAFVIFVFIKIFINGNLDYILPDRFPKILSRFFLFIVIFVISFIFIFLLNNLKSIIHNKSFIVIAFLVIPLLMSVMLIIITKVEPKSDFLTYYLIARNLSLNKIFIPNYIAMFPHTISFPFFLSLVFRIFGSSVIIAQLTGSVLSALSVILIYVIGKEIGNRELGFFAALLWALMPSRILYSLLICTENLFNVVALVITFLFIKTLKTTNANKRVLYILLIGIFSAWLSSIRPNEIIILIAIILYFLFFAKINLTSPNMLKIFTQNIFPIKLFLTLITIIIYLLTTFVINYTIESKIRQKIASPRIG
ncbi:glycosyltransferase family 39 protein [Caldicellulosiruptor naganoensis]|uniref:Glycosyltransferase family 39 protein n=1 Tax=Caldicellulosiruptor naganoensis TaxID=29324 RepID=A0ABY7BEY7_9FIRM|nr:glycosyltransferase family 39 protein [Caldicellulosiruptor naganoensis]WAM31377.1 glycosyltransferase family 39 protein [Caldicellulosiruptor naganoensis]